MPEIKIPQIYAYKYVTNRSYMIMNNPLQKYFRQPKVYIGLPSKGVYSKPGTYQGDVAHLPVCGMTGMDEIILKTPDALLSGESTANIITSCISGVRDPWEVSIIDIIPLLAAIRIATYGNEMHITNRCPSCGEENEYDIDLNKVIEYYMPLQFGSKIVLKEITINIQPLNYRQSTDFNIRNFKLQQQIAQANVLEDKKQQQEVINNMFQELAKIQAEIFMSIVESVDIGNQVVTEKQFIAEWLTNCDRDVYDVIKEQNQKNNDTWAMPKFPVKCNHCEHESSVSIELDNSSFFAPA